MFACGALSKLDGLFRELLYDQSILYAIISLLLFAPSNVVNFCFSVLYIISLLSFNCI